LRNLKFTIQYLGSNYLGWQVQPNGPTIQGLIQQALQDILQQPATIISASRTDSGVHALAQVAHFRTEHVMDPATLQRALNSKLPPDISVLAVEEAADFHAQKNAVSKSYAYFLLNSEHRIPVLQATSWRLYGKLDLDAMHRCLELLVGEHDFNAFKAADSSAKTSVRRLMAVSLQRIPLESIARNLGNLFGVGSLVFPETAVQETKESKGLPALIAIGFKGRGFLKHMVRNIIGTVAEVGLGRMTVERFREIFDSRDRTQAGKTAPPQGLFLLKIDYD
jgi:pseudouridylate synthase I